MSIMREVVNIKPAKRVDDLKELTQKLNETNEALNYIVDEIQQLLESAIEQKSFKIRFHNPKLAKCWEVKQCNNTKCPAYKSEDQRCWHVAGTFCKGKVQGTFAKKLGDCRKCEVYQQAVSTKLYAIGEVFNNMMEMLEEKNQEVRDYAQNLEDRVKERTAELEQATEKLRDSEEKFRKITTSAQDAILMMDNDGNISHWNEAAEKIFGHSAQEVMGKDLHILLAPQRYYKAYREGVERFKTTGKGHVVGKILELAALKKDGTEFPIELSFSAVRLKGKWNAIGILRDITERKHKEEEIKRNTEMLQKANQELKQTQAQLIQAGKLAAIGQLAAGISHELNNPLGGILGYSQFILEKAQRKDGPENLGPEELKNIFTYIGYIERESQRCKSIVSNLLKFSRASKTDVAPLDINQVLEETFIFTRHQLEINRVELIQEFTPHLPLVRGNEHQLQQVFTNIMVNAQQAMPEGGKLTVSTAINDGLVEITFADSGRGIPKEHLDKLFDPFFTTKQAGEGTGLGLSVSYGIIQNHQGTIEVESKLGQGTTFRIKLPVKVIDAKERTGHG